MPPLERGRRKGGGREKRAWTRRQPCTDLAEAAQQRQSSVAVTAASVVCRWPTFIGPEPHTVVVAARVENFIQNFLVHALGHLQKRVIYTLRRFCGGLYEPQAIPAGKNVAFLVRNLPFFVIALVAH